LQPGHDVENRDAAAIGAPVGIAGEAHQPGGRLHDQVVPREDRATTRTETTDRRVHHVRIGSHDGVVVQAELRQTSRPKVLDDHIRSSRQLLRKSAVVGIAEVEHDVPLVPVDSEVIGRDAIPLRRQPPPRLIATRRLHLDHIRTQISHDLRRKRTSEDTREIRNEDAGQRIRRS
jgi:hypothetical protein